MSDTIELNDKLVSELRDIAKSLGIAEADELRKAQLVTAIVKRQQLIEAARNQESIVNDNYSEKTAVPAEVVEAGNNGEKTRKRTRTIKSKNEPRVEVPLNDTNLFEED